MDKIKALEDTVKVWERVRAIVKGGKVSQSIWELKELSMHSLGMDDDVKNVCLLCEYVENQKGVEDWMSPSDCVEHCPVRWDAWGNSGTNLEKSLYYPCVTEGSWYDKLEESEEYIHEEHLPIIDECIRIFKEALEECRENLDKDSDSETGEKA